MHLFLAPHSDDAVFSCGGQIAGLVRQGEPVVIYTVMAGHPPSNFRPTAFTQELHDRWRLGTEAVRVVDRRRDEDAAAAWALGAGIEFGPHPEAVYRLHPATGQALYPDEQAIFGAVHPAEPLTIPLLEAALLDRVQEPITALYAPLGVGGHVDHQLTRDLGLALARRFPEIPAYFYEEYPYARGEEGVIDRALQAFGQPLRHQICPLDDVGLAAKIRASACYRSQISTFWSDDAALADELRAYTAQAGGEHCWLLRRDGERAE